MLSQLSRIKWLKVLKSVKLWTKNKILFNQSLNIAAKVSSSLNLRRDTSISRNGELKPLSVSAS